MAKTTIRRYADDGRVVRRGTDSCNGQLRHQHDLADILPVLEAQMSLRRLREWEARIDVWLYLSFAIQNQKPVHRDRKEGIVPKMTEIHTSNAAVLVH